MHLVGFIIITKPKIVQFNIKAYYDLLQKLFEVFICLSVTKKHFSTNTEAAETPCGATGKHNTLALILKQLQHHVELQANTTL